MRQRDNRRPRSRVVTCACAMAMIVVSCLGFVSVASASKTFEQVGCFAGTKPEPCEPVKEGEAFGEEVELGGTGGMAVNYTGAGGVPAGTVYAMTGTLTQAPAVVMFVPSAGGLKFYESWRVASLEEPYERCGPALGTKMVGGKEVAEHPCALRVAQQAQAWDVAVDETDGRLFVDNGTSVPGRKMIVIYNPDGSKVEERFGELAAESETIAESPEKLHTSLLGMTVNGAGEAFISDEDTTSHHHRLARFKPNESGIYEYAGSGEDVGAGVYNNRPSYPVTDAAGHVYVTSAGTYIEEYDPAHPTDPPVCSFEFKQAGISAITVDPLSGAVFFFSYRKQAGFAYKSVHELSPCDEGTGKFVEVGQFEVKPERDSLSALAFDPVRELSVGRGPGTLYGAAPGPVPPLGFGPGEEGQSSLGYVFAGTPESPPVITEEPARGVLATSAQLRARIDPENYGTHYVFQYETEMAFNGSGGSFVGAMEAPMGGAELPGSKTTQSVSAILTGLEPQTEYRYRVLATSKGCPAESEEECKVSGEVRLLRTFPIAAAGLPDGRAYELVSPAQKHGGEVYPADAATFSYSCGPTECNQRTKPGTLATHLPMQSAPDGDALAYEGTSFAPGRGAVSENEYVSRRTAAGWQTVDPTPALSSSRHGTSYAAFSADLGEALVVQEELRPVLSPQAPSEYENIYSQSTEAAPFAPGPLIGEEPAVRSAGDFRVVYAGASADLSRVFFAADDALTSEVSGIAPEAPPVGAGEYDLYEYDRDSGELHLVNVAPGNATGLPGSSLAPAGTNAISTDGSRAFFSDSSGQVYVRIDGSETRRIEDPGKFLAASTDGSRVLLADGCLYSLASEACTDLTEGKGGFVGVVGRSEDLSRVYFLDTEVLDKAPACREVDLGGSEVCGEAEAGKDNLYAWQEGGPPRFIARLLSSDDENISGGDWKPNPAERTAEASPDGRYLAFLSRAQPTGFDNTSSPCAYQAGATTAATPAPCAEVFLYDSATGQLHCPSCNPTGTPPLGYSSLPLNSQGVLYPQPRYLFDSGRLFFDSQDTLSLLDTNEGVEDVYEFEPQSTGSCGRENGCVSLISAGRGDHDSNFLAADSSGANVFFTTTDRLVRSDEDELFDVYDAREGGGFAEPKPPIPCQGEACQPQVPVPAEVIPASATFAGPENYDFAGLVDNVKPAVKPAGGHVCAKGKVEKKGKCVVSQQRKKRQEQKKKKRASKGKAKHHKGGH